MCLSIVSFLLSLIFVSTLVNTDATVSNVLEVNESIRRGSGASENDVNSSGSGSDGRRDYSGLGWISYALSEKLSRFRPRTRTNHLCNHQSDLYERSLKNLTLWAVQMKEASATSTEGLLVGKRFYLGHFDECIAVQTPSVTGRYCLIQIAFAPSRLSHPEFYTNELEGETAAPYSNAWESMKKSKSPYRLDRDVISWGICVPSACSAQDVEESLMTSFADIEREHGITLRLSTSDRLCSSSTDDEPLPLSFRAIKYLLVFLTTLAVVVTVYHLTSGDLNARDKGKFGLKFLSHFSMVNNFRRLCRASDEKSLNVLDGWRFHSTIRIILIHRVLTLISLMVFNPAYHESKLEYAHLLFVGGYVFDTYFSISGFLMFYLWYSPLKQHGSKIIPSIIFKMWLRFMPSYLIMLIFTAVLLPYLSDGPHWKSITSYEAEKCQRYGWTNLLAINNIVGTDSMDTQCVPQTTWYVACEFQLLPLGILIVYAFSRSHTLGRKLAFISLAASIIIPFLLVFINGYDGAQKFSKNFLIDPFKDEYFRNIHIKSYSRAVSYVVGIISAFLLLQIKENKWTLSTPKRWLVLLVAVLLGDGAPFYGFLFYTKKYNALENALFASIHRSLWSIMICTVIVIHLAWGFGKNNFHLVLTHNFYVPLGRLSYLAFLFHPMWQLMTTASSRSPLYLSNMYIGWMVAGDIFICFLASLVFYLIIEGPVSSIRTSLLSTAIEKRQTVKNVKLQDSAKLD